MAQREMFGEQTMRNLEVDPKINTKIVKELI